MNKWIDMFNKVAKAAQMKMYSENQHLKYCFLLLEFSTQAEKPMNQWIDMFSIFAKAAPDKN